MSSMTVNAYHDAIIEYYKIKDYEEGQKQQSTTFINLQSTYNFIISSLRSTLSTFTAINASNINATVIPNIITTTNNNNNNITQTSFSFTFIYNCDPTQPIIELNELKSAWNLFFALRVDYLTQLGFTFPDLSYQDDINNELLPTPDQDGEILPNPIDTEEEEAQENSAVFFIFSFISALVFIFSILIL
jgi:hypothetical protein